VSGPALSANDDEVGHYRYSRRGLRSARAGIARSLF
jgi:hypothetical protein